MEGSKEAKIRDTFKISTLFLGSTTILLKFFLNPNEMAVSPRRGVEIYVTDTWNIRWLIHPKLGFLYCWFRRYWLASSRFGIRLRNLISHVFAASDCMKERPFSAIVEAEVWSNFLFAQDSSFSGHALPPLPVGGFWKFLHFLNLFYFIYFLFLSFLFNLTKSMLS